MITFLKTLWCYFFHGKYWETISQTDTWGGFKFETTFKCKKCGLTQYESHFRGK